MIEYILTKDITTYIDPPHMRRQNAGANFFEKWIPKWDIHLQHLYGKNDVVGIEIGSFNGDCAVFCAEKIVTGTNSIHYTIDTNESEFLKNNIAPYSNIKFIKGRSYDVLKNSFKNINADYIFIDGSHLAIDVLSDAVLSWGILKNNGILIFDDYGWGIHTKDEKQKPKLAIDAFLSAYREHYQILEHGWQIFLKKLPYTYSTEELENNYQ